MLNVERLKAAINDMPLDRVCEAVLELRMDGLVLDQRTPFGKVHFNACFAEIEALLQRAGYHRALEVLGYQGRMYALYDPARWQPMKVLRCLKALAEENPLDAASEYRFKG